MKPNLKLATLLIGSIFSFSVLATELPEIKQPEELQSGEFAEGMMTELSAEDIKKFLPWAQNARKILDDALAESLRFSLFEKVNFLESEMKRVVQGSGNKNYQLLMRSSLNRGLLLSKILKEESDINDPGILQNHLSILVGSIELAKFFFESDNAFQQKAQDNKVRSVPYALFAKKMGHYYLPISLSIFDTSAQYRVLYKTLEMINWDMAQDENAMGAELAEPIVDIFRTLQRLPLNPKTDIGLLAHIQTMNFLVQKLNKGQWLNPVVLVPVSVSVSANVVKEEIKRKDHFVLVQRNSDRSEIWKDEKSGLIWGDKLPKNMNHVDAKNACTGLPNFDGKSWRLPTKEEFESANTNGIRSALPNMNYTFWSSSVHAFYPNSAWLFNGYSGDLYYYNRHYSGGSVRCVAR